MHKITEWFKKDESGDIPFMTPLEGDKKEVREVKDSKHSQPPHDIPKTSPEVLLQVLTSIKIEIYWEPSGTFKEPK